MKYSRLVDEVQVLDALPDGWVREDRATTAPNGYYWANNNKSLFKPGYESALIKEDERVQLERSHKETQAQEHTDIKTQTYVQPKQQISQHKAKAPSRGTIITEESAYPMQQLARHQAILRLLQDIRFDMQVCALEGGGRA